MSGLKGSLYRKRYVLIKEDSNGNLEVALDKIRTKFGSKMKFREDPYAIVLTDQFQKDSLCLYIEKELKGIAVVTVSGTIKKCKEKIVS
ncbi:MAG: hypothetical protein ACP5OC_00590 [Thermoplasmata archaeon]